MTSQTNRSTTAEIIRYGAYLPRYRAPSGGDPEVLRAPRPAAGQGPGHAGPRRGPADDGLRGRRRGPEGAEAPGTLIAVSQSPPFGLRKLSATLARALGLAEVVPLDVGGSPAAALDAMQLAGALSARGPRPWWWSPITLSPTRTGSPTPSAPAGRRPSWSAPRAASPAFAPQARAGREVYDVWRLGTEPEPRYRLEVLFDAYAASAKEALAPGAGHRAPRVRVRRRLRQPAPPPDAARARPAGGQRRAAREHELRGRDRQPGAASVGIALALGLDGAAPGDHLVALGYGGGEAIAQEIEVTGPVPAAGTAAQIPGEAIDLSTYYRWTRGRQAEPTREA